MNDLPPQVSPLISPTKARRDAALAKDWAYVSSWLTKKYSPQPVPQFEKNAETLGALLELVASNEAADHEVELIRRAEEEELKRYEQEVGQTDGGPCQVILRGLEAAMDERGTIVLGDLAEASLLLGTLSADPSLMGERIIELSHEKFEIEEHLHRINDLQSQLELEVEVMKSSIEKVQCQIDEVEQEDIQQRTAQLNRETRQINTKIGQYSERITALKKFTVTSPTISEVRKQERRVQKLQAKVKASERRIADFQGLPPDLERARGEYRRAQNQLLGLRQRRAEIFESMVDK